MPRGKPIKINIVNLRKNDSLFNYGLLPCLYSIEEAKRVGRGWHRGGTAVKYFKNDHQIENTRRYYFTLTFTITSHAESDTLLVAHSYPYTVSDLSTYLDNIEKIKYKRELIER